MSGPVILTVVSLSVVLQSSHVDLSVAGKKQIYDHVLGLEKNCDAILKSTSRKPLPKSASL